MNFFNELYKSLRAMGVRGRDARQIVSREKSEQAADRNFRAAFGADFAEMLQRHAPVIEKMTDDILRRNLQNYLPVALPPILWQLAQGNPDINGENNAEDPGTLCACLSRETGAYWGEAPGGGDASNNAFHASMAYDSEHDRYTITYKGGTVTSFGGGSTTFEGGERTSSGNPIYAYLFHTRPVAQGGVGSWIMEFESAFPSASDGEVMVPLWHFDYARNGGGSLTQETEGAVVMPEIRNVVDVTDSSQGDQSE